MANTDCPSCARLRIVQCNRCRETNPNAQTLKRRAIVETLMANPGMTAAEAEALHGVTAGPTINA